MWSLVAAMPSTSRTFRLTFAWGTTPTRSSVAFACGRRKDTLEVGDLERLALGKLSGKLSQHVTVLRNDGCSLRKGFVEQPPDFLVDGLGGPVGVGRRFAGRATEEA